MDVRELRIGNFLNSERFGICQVITIYKNNFDVSTEGKHKKEWFLGLECNPIPITEEWLLKFGFTQSPAFKSVYFIGTFLNITLGSKIMFEINDQIISEIQYIHQLQNLYFALTGKELTYE